MHGSVTVAGLDHLVFAVRSIDAAARRFSHLGFRLTPRGGHPAMGSANHTFVFPGNDYGELLSAEKDGAFTGYFRNFAEEAEGLAGVAFRIDDVAAARAVLLGAGFAPEETLHFARPVEVDGTLHEARFSVIQLPLGSLPGGRVFFVQHHTPELVWRPDMMDHPNGVQGITGIILVDEEPEAARAAYRRLDLDSGFGLEVLTAKAFEDRYHEPAPAGRFAGVRFRVSDPERTAMVLSVGGVRFVETGEGIEVPTLQASGTRLVFQR